MVKVNSSQRYNSYKCTTGKLREAGILWWEEKKRHIRSRNEGQWLSPVMPHADLESHCSVHGEPGPDLGELSFTRSRS